MTYSLNIILDNVKKSYGQRLVLDIKNYEFKSGDITCIMGQNGAGKSTLLKIIAGLEPEFEGQVRYGARELDRDIYSNMTMVFQTPHLLKKTVFENITYPLKIRNFKKDEIQKRVDNMLELFAIKELSNKLAHKLSGGESQKVALARAMVFKPSLLLLDEPTSGIDVSSVPIIENAITSFCKENNATIIMITHSKAQAKRLSDNLIFINKQGQITQEEEIV